MSELQNPTADTGAENPGSGSQAAAIAPAFRLGLFLFIFISGAYIILHGIGKAPYGSNDGQFIIEALDILKGTYYPGTGPLLGNSSVLHGPITYYLFAIPLYFYRGPLAIYMFTAFLNILVLLLIYATGRKHFGPAAGLLALFFFAYNPQIISQARAIIDKSVTNIFIVLTYIAIFAILSGKHRKWGWLLFPPAAVCAFQIHFQTALLIAAAVFFFFVFHVRVDRPQLALGVILAVVSILPVFLGSDARGLAVLFPSPTAVHSSLDPANMRTWGRMQIEPPLLIMIVSLAVLFAGGAALVLREFLKRKTADPAAVFCAAYALVSVPVIYMYPEQAFYRYYSCYPAAVFTAGFFVSKALAGTQAGRKPSPRSKFQAGAVFAAALLAASLPAALWNARVFGATEDSDQAGHLKANEKAMRLIVNELGIDRAQDLKNIHGAPFLRTMGDGGALFRILADSARPRRIQNAKHVVMMERSDYDSLPGRPLGTDVITAAPYVFVRYTPSIEYEGMVFSNVPQPGWVRKEFRPFGWHKYERHVYPVERHFENGASVWGVPHGDEKSFFFRGKLAAAPRASARLIFVSVSFSENRSSFRKGTQKVKAELYLNGRKAEALPEKVYDPDYYLENHLFAFRTRPEDNKAEAVFALSVELPGVPWKTDADFDVFDLSFGE